MICVAGVCDQPWDPGSEKDMWVSSCSDKYSKKCCHMWCFMRSWTSRQALVYQFLIIYLPVELDICGVNIIWEPLPWYTVSTVNPADFFFCFFWVFFPWILWHVGPLSTWGTMTDYFVRWDQCISRCKCTAPESLAAVPFGCIPRTGHNSYTVCIMVRALIFHLASWQIWHCKSEWWVSHKEIRWCYTVSVGISVRTLCSDHSNWIVSFASLTMQHTMKKRQIQGEGSAEQNLCCYKVLCWSLSGVTTWQCDCVEGEISDLYFFSCFCIWSYQCS